MQAFIKFIKTRFPQYVLQFCYVIILKVLNFIIPHVCENCFTVIETHITGKGENMAKHKIGNIYF